MIRTKRPPNKMISDINITPFTDVCLVLLIIFMVTATTLTQESKLDLSLPQAATGDALLPQSVTVRITHDQQLFLNEEAVTFATLRERLVHYHDEEDIRLLVVKADEDIPYRLVIRTIDLARQVGMDDIALATREPETASLTAMP